MRLLKSFVACCALAAVGLLFTECRKKDYDLSKGLNTEMTVGGDSLTIPLGSIKPVRLDSIIDAESADILEKSEQGEYAIRMKDSVLTTIAGIAPVAFALEPFDIEPVVQEMDPVEFEEIKIDAVRSTIEAVKMPEISFADEDMPSIDSHVERLLTVGAGGDIGLPELGELTVDFDDIAFEEKSSVEVAFHFDNPEPEKLKSVDRVYFDNRTVSITLDKSGLNRIATTLADSIAEFSVTIPPRYLISHPSPGAAIDEATNTFSIKNLKLGKGVEEFTASFQLDGVVLSEADLQAGVIDVVDEVAYRFRYGARGTASAEALSGLESVKLAFHLSAAPRFADAEITLNDIDIDIRIDGNEGGVGTASFEQEVTGLPEQLDRLNTLTFAEGAGLVLDITDPGIEPLAFGDKGTCKVVLPSKFTFGRNDYLKKENGRDVLEIPVKELFRRHEIGILSMQVDQAVTDGKIRFEDEATYEISGVQLMGQTLLLSELQAVRPRDIDITVTAENLVVAEAAFTTKSIHFDIVEENIEISLDEEVAEEAKKLYAVELKDGGTKISLNIAVSELPEEIDRIYFDEAYIEFPEAFRFADGELDEHNRMSLGEGFNPHVGYSKEIHLLGFDFGEKGTELHDGRFSYAGSIKMSGKAHINSTTLTSDDLGTIVVTPSIEVDSIRIGSIVGLVDPTIDAVDENIELDLPEVLMSDKNNLDITDPVITFEIGNTLAIPVDVDVELTAKRNGQETTAIKTSLSIAPAEVQGTAVWSRYRLAKQESVVPDGYTLVSPEGFADLLRTIPDEIAVRALPKVQGERHRVELDGAENRIDLKYGVDVPLSFGKDFYLEYTDTIGGLGESIGDFLPYLKGLDVIAAAQNGIPLDLTLELQPVDKDGIPLDGVSVPRGTIASCGMDAGGQTAAKTSRLLLRLAQEEGGELDCLDAFVLKVSATSNSTVAGMPLKGDQGLGLELKVRIPGGVTVNLDELSDK